MAHAHTSGAKTGIMELFSSLGKTRLYAAATPLSCSTQLQLRGLDITVGVTVVVGDETSGLYLQHIYSFLSTEHFPSISTKRRIRLQRCLTTAPSCSLMAR